MKSCYIVAAAELAPERLRPEPGDMLIAADAGLLHLERLGLAPDLALGDFESLGYVPEAPQVEVCPVRKDDTDTMAALRRALELGYRRALIFGGLGGRRFDHSLANVQALAWACLLYTSHKRIAKLAEAYDDFVTKEYQNSLG